MDSIATMDPALAALYDQKTRKLEEQKMVSDEMNAILTKQGGLNENSRLATKNLVAAISVSQKPGYFAYHKTPQEVKEIEDTRVLNKLARRIQKLGRELDQINADIDQSSIRRSKVEPTSMSSLDQWFQTFGRPEGESLPDQITTFAASKKIYGGTAHHRSFRTQSTTPTWGLVTR
jgi:hypothetical protein